MLVRSLSHVAVIGMGNWGTSLAAALDAVPGAIVERVHAQPRRRSWNARRNAQLLEARILWLCVPDAQILSTTDWLVSQRGDLHGQIVVHSSGALDRRVLVAAERAGASTGSVHPMMSFPTRRVVSLANTRFGVEAADVATRRALFALVRSMDGSPFAVDTNGKVMYHVGAMFGSPFLVAALAAGVRCLREAGIEEQEALTLLGPMAAATIANVQRQGLARSFSGPLARGDAATVKLHRQALAGHPLMAQVYDALAKLAERDLPSADHGAVGAVLNREVLAGSSRRSRPAGRTKR